MAKALAWCGFIAESSGWTGTPGGMEQELELAERRQRRALELAEGAGDDVVAADVRMLLLATMTRRIVAGLPIPAEEFAELTAVAVDSYERLGDDYGAGIVRLTESITALAAGDLHHAASANEAAQAHAQRSGDRFAMGRVEWMLGMLDDVNGDALGAHRHIERSLRFLDELGMAQAVTAQAGMLIPLAERAGMPELASQWRAYVEGRTPGSARDDILTMASARNGEGLRARSDGDFDRAHDAHLEALGWYDEASVSGGTAFTQSCLGFLAAATGDPVQAASHHREALAAAEVSNEPAALALAIEGAASVVADQDPGRAATLLGGSRALWTMASAASNRTHRDDIDQVSQAVAASLGEPAYEAAVQAGVGLESARAHRQRQGGALPSGLSRTTSAPPQRPSAWWLHELEPTTPGAPPASRPAPTPPSAPTGTASPP